MTAFVQISSTVVRAGRKTGAAVSTRRDTVVAISKAPQQTTVTVPRRKPKGPAPVLHTDGDMLEDTPDMIMKVAATGLLAAWEIGSIVAACAATPASVPSAVVGAIAGYLFADFGSGIYHWSLDNYGSKDTPVFGYQIDAFQGHHKSPWTITKRGFFNNVSKPAVAGFPLFLGLILTGMPMVLESFLCSTVVFAVLAQELHKWAHMISPPGPVKQLMNTGLAISTKVHGLHHHDPFEGNYCIVSGLCNNFLDEIHFFRKLEGIVYKMTGNTPICWDLDPSLRTLALGEEKAN